MSRSAVLLAALTDEPTSTSDLYARVGYLALAGVGLIPYATFRAELAKLSAAGLADSQTAGDGSTVWKLARCRAPSAERPRCCGRSETDGEP